MNFISKTAKIGENVGIGHFTVIEDDVTIGDDTIIGNNVTIYKGTKIGNNLRIDDNTVIGKQPMRAANSIFKETGEIKPCEIGDGCIIGTSVVIYAGCRIDQKCLIADLATVREDVTIGEKTIIGRGAAVENLSTVGSYCKIETNAYITAYSVVEDHVFIAPGVVTTNDNYMGKGEERLKHIKGPVIREGSRIGGNATILPGKEIQKNGTVAAGSIVTKDVEQDTLVMGSPAAPYIKHDK